MDKELNLRREREEVEGTNEIMLKAQEAARKEAEIEFNQLCKDIWDNCPINLVADEDTIPNVLNTLKRLGYTIKKEVR